MGLRTEVVDLVGLYFLDDARQVGGVGQVAVMQDEILVLDMMVLVDVVHPLGIEQRGAALDAVHFITLFQQQLRQIGAVLTCDARDQRFLTFHFVHLFHE